jgi:hypothetical protein
MIPVWPQISQSAGMRRDDISIYVSASNRTRLAALVDDRNTPSKVVRHAETVLATAERHGTNAIMRRTGKSEPCVWRLQERFYRRGRRGADARQDPAFAQAAASRPRHRVRTGPPYRPVSFVSPWTRGMPCVENSAKAANSNFGQQTRSPAVCYHATKTQSSLCCCWARVELPG